jgi:hypothetical protein
MLYSKSPNTITPFAFNSTQTQPNVNYSNVNDTHHPYKSNSTSVVSTISNMKILQKSLEEKIKLFEKTSKGDKFLHSSLSSKIRKKKKDRDGESALMFYNSLSLIMLAMIAGGLVGVIFILYFSFKKEDYES